MNINFLLKTRKLKKIPKDIEKSKSSIKIAKSRIIESQNLLKEKFYKQSILSSYTSMFHSARALLYKDGIQEKSHYATLVYLKEKYSKTIPLNILNNFENYMRTRHNILYGLEDSNESNQKATNSIKTAKAFLSIINNILE